MTLKIAIGDRVYAMVSNSGECHIEKKRKSLFDRITKTGQVDIKLFDSKDRAKELNLEALEISTNEEETLMIFRYSSAESGYSQKVALFR